MTQGGGSYPKSQGSGGSGAESTGFQLPGYEIQRRIGRGGFAVVYEAVQLSLGRSVAIKVLMADLEAAGDRARFERERQLLTLLSEHRQVVDVIDAGVAQGGRPYIVMRLYRRGSLSQLLETSGPMRTSDAVTTIVKVGSALQAAHDHGALHRDVKPENIFISDDGEPALGDFGIASIIGVTGSSTTAFFSLSHVAPEVLEHPDSRLTASDVYSLGSTAYTLLAGRSPFKGASDLHRIQLIMESAPPPLGRVDVPPGVEAAIRRAMAKNPADRFPTVRAFTEALTTALAEPRRAAPGPTSSQLPGGYPPTPSTTRPRSTPGWQPPAAARPAGPGPAYPNPQPSPAPQVPPRAVPPPVAPPQYQQPLGPPAAAPGWGTPPGPAFAYPGYAGPAAVGPRPDLGWGWVFLAPVTCGFLLFVPFLYAAVRTGRFWSWVSAASYSVWIILFFGFFAIATPEQVNADGGVADAVVLLHLLVVAFSLGHILWIRFSAPSYRR